MRLAREASKGSRPAIAGAALLAAAAIALSPAAGSAEEPDSSSARPSAPSVKVYGFAQFDYRRADESAPDTASRHEFNVRRARLGVRGAVTPAIRYQLVLQGDGLTANSASVLDAVLDARIAPGLNLRVGQFKYDFDIEARRHDMLCPMIDRTYVANTVAGSLDGRSTASVQLSNARDRGIALQASRKAGSWEWRPAVGIFQGTGRASDENNQVSVTGQLAVEGGPGLLLSGGYLYSDNEPSGETGIDRFSGWTVGAQYEAHPLYACGEYYRAKRDLGTSDEDVEGFYVIGGFDPFPNFDVRVRYQTLQDGEFAPGDDRAQSVDVGARWFFARMSGGAGTSIVANVMFRDADSGFDRGLTVLNDGRGEPLTDGSQAGTVGIVRMQFEF